MGLGPSRLIHKGILTKIIEKNISKLGSKETKTKSSLIYIITLTNYNQSMKNLLILLSITTIALTQSCQPWGVRVQYGEQLVTPGNT